MRILLCIFGILIAPAISFAGKVSSACIFNGIPLYGRVRVVTIGQDIKVRKVTIAEDVRVHKVTIAPNRCGKWEFVTIGEDFTIRFVPIAEDIKIRFVNIAEGIR